MPREKRLDDTIASTIAASSLADGTIGPGMGHKMLQFADQASRPLGSPALYSCPNELT